MFAVWGVPAVPHHVVVAALRQLLELNKLLVCQELHSAPRQAAPQLTSKLTVASNVAGSGSAGSVCFGAS